MTRSPNLSFNICPPNQNMVYFKRNRGGYHRLSHVTVVHILVRQPYFPTSSPQKILLSPHIVRYVVFTPNSSVRAIYFPFLLIFTFYFPFFLLSSFVHVFSHFLFPFLFFFSPGWYCISQYPLHQEVERGGGGGLFAK